MTKHATVYGSLCLVAALVGGRVSLQLLQGLNHPQELERIETTLPPAVLEVPTSGQCWSADCHAPTT